MFRWIGRIIEKLIANLLTIVVVVGVAYFFVTKFFL